MVLKKIDKIPFVPTIILCLTLGLAPYSPPHIYEKAMMIMGGKTLLAMDWFDIVIHGSSWLLLGLKIIIKLKSRSNKSLLKKSL